MYSFLGRIVHSDFSFFGFIRCIKVCRVWYFVFSCPGSSIPDLGQWVTHRHIRILTQRVTFETWDPADISVMSWQKDRKTKWQKESLILRRQGQFPTIAMFFPSSSQPHSKIPILYFYDVHQDHPMFTIETHFMKYGLSSLKTRITRDVGTLRQVALSCSQLHWYCGVGDEKQNMATAWMCSGVWWHKRDPVLCSQYSLWKSAFHCH